MSHVLHAKNDRHSMKLEDVEGVVRKLCVSYALVRRSFIKNESNINQMLDNGDLTQAVSALGKVFHLPPAFRKRVGYNAKKIGPNALAAMHMKVHRFYGVPVSGHMLFLESKEVALRQPRYRLLHMIAHELSHARMYLDRHELATSEFATDLLAMLVMGNASDFRTYLNPLGAEYGYVRPSLYDEVFKSMEKYYDKIYL